MKTSCPSFLITASASAAAAAVADREVSCGHRLSFHSLLDQFKRKNCEEVRFSHQAMNVEDPRTRVCSCDGVGVEGGIAHSIACLLLHPAALGLIPGTTCGNLVLINSSFFS